MRLQLNVVLPCLAIASSLHAQAPDSTTLPRVIVTAERVPVPAVHVTSTVTVLDARALRAAGVTHLLDALRQVPGLSIVRSGSFGGQTSVFARGGESDYTRVLVDGTPMNDPGGAVDLGSFSLDDIERIEVVRGPASVVHGSDAVSAVVQILTRRAGSRMRAHLDAGGGSYGSSSLAAGAEARLATLGGAGTVARHASDGMLPFNNQYANTTASARLSLDGRVPVSLSVRHSDNAFHYPTDGAGAVVDHNARRRDRRSSAALEGTRSLGQTLVARASAGWLETAGRTDDPPDGAADTVGFYLYSSRGSVRRHHVATSVQWTPRASQSLVLGGEWAAEHQRSTDTSNYAFERSHFDANRITRAAFAQLLGAGSRGSYSVGARIDDNDVYGTFRTARAAAAWNAGAGVRLRAGVGNAFKAPTFLEQFSTAFSVGNAGLEPERSTSWEVGIEQHGTRATFGATWFAQRFRDLIQYTYISPTDPSYFNVAAARASGLELEGTVSPTNATTLRGAVTLLRTRVDDAGFDTGAGATFVDGARLLRRPGSTVAVGGTSRVGSRVTVDYQLTRIGDRDDRDFSSYPAVPVRLDAYTRADASSQVRLTPVAASTVVTLVLRADNLFGASYTEIARFAAPRRVLFAGLRAEWGVR